METEIKLPTFTCLRCGHIWIPRKTDYPRMCPKCKSVLWDKSKGDNNDRIIKREQGSSGKFAPTSL